jgi:serine/threonine protein phosphatase PrpC
MSLTLRYAAQSDRGLIRDGNQDSVFAGPRLLAVADGMGGMAAGDVASNIVIGTMAPLDEDVPGSDLIDKLRGSVAAANQRLRDTVDANPQMEGMGTTLTALLFSGSRFGVVHVGDSRAYLLRDGVLAQVTKDDSYVQMLVDEGRITPEEATSHPQRSLLTRALDGRDVEPEFSVREARPGDRYLLCSDGLYSMISFETIDDAMQTLPDPQECVERLVQLALRGGGTDNVTVVIADVTDADIVEQQPIVGGAAAEDRGMGTAADPASPAARAAAARAARQGSPAEAPPEQPDGAEPRKRHPIRTGVIVLVVLALLGAGGYGLWRYTRGQYYVGATSDRYVAVFQGVPGSFAGLRLSSVEIKSGTRLDDLTSLARGRVQQGIRATGRTDALNTMAAITNDDPSNTNKLPVCASPTPTPSSPHPTPTGKTPSPTPTGRASSSPSSAAGSTSASPTPTGGTAGSQQTNCRPGK